MQTRTSRVLCVDADAPTLTLRKTLLEAAGYSVLTAASGREALRIMDEKSDVDLVLLDYVMPGMNGDELAERLRRSGRERHGDELYRTLPAGDCRHRPSIRRKCSWTMAESFRARR